jgi:hypothetical protein
VIADTLTEESVQAVDFRAGQNFGEAQAETRVNTGILHDVA